MGFVRRSFPLSMPRCEWYMAKILLVRIYDAAFDEIVNENISLTLIYESNACVRWMGVAWKTAVPRKLYMKTVLSLTVAVRFVCDLLHPYPVLTYLIKYIFHEFDSIFIDGSTFFMLSRSVACNLYQSQYHGKLLLLYLHLQENKSTFSLENKKKYSFDILLLSITKL